jgi:hypothetical protein
LKPNKEQRSASAKLGHLRRVQRNLERYKEGYQDKCVSLYGNVCACGHCRCLHAPIIPNLLFYGQCERCDCPHHEFLLDLPEFVYKKAIEDRAKLKQMISGGVLPKLLTPADLETHKKYNQSLQ